MSSQALPGAPAASRTGAIGTTWRGRRLAVPGGFELAVFEAGRTDAAAPVLVLVHGMGHWTQAAWTLLATEFEATHRIVAFDLPGFGASDKPRVPYTLPFFTGALDAVVRSSADGHIALAGHSLGGLIAASYAADRPEAIGALTLIDPAGFLRTPALALRVMGSGPVLSLMRSVKPSPGFVRRTLHSAVYDPAAIPPEDVAHAIALSRDPAVSRAFFAVYAGAMNEMVHMKALHARFATWRGPTLLVWGREDRFVPVRALAEARRVYPAAEVLEIERCGHCPNIERPALLAERMRAIVAV